MFSLPTGEASVYTYKTVQGADPAANTEIQDTVPAGKYWLLMSVTVQLVQGATQTPQPVLVIDDGTHTIAQLPAATTAQNASVTCQYTWAGWLPQLGGGAATIATGPLPPLLLPAGYRINTLTAGKGANTNYGAPTYFVCELG